MGSLAGDWRVGRRAVRTKDERNAAREQRQAEQAKEREERRRRNRERIEELRRTRAEREARKAATVWLPALGVCVYNGEVRSHGNPSGGSSDMLASMERRNGMETKLLGPLAGARADVVGGRAGHRRSGNARVADAALATSVLGPAGLLTAASRTGFQGIAVVTFTDGAYHEKKINDAAALVRAQAEAIRFNALAGSDEMPATAGGADQTGQLADELERLAKLRDSGALTDGEFQAAKARLLGL